MRLKRIELNDDFRSLQNGFTLNFVENENSYNENQAIEPYCIVGKNGSGKSNILELLSVIFYQVEINYLNFLPKEKRPKNYKKENSDENLEEVYEELKIFQSFDTSPNAYKLEYYFTNDEKEVLITIEKEAGKAINIYGDKDLSTPLSKSEAKSVLPEYVIGYSSGQNEIISLPFFKMRLIQHDEYIDYLSKEIEFNSHESRMIYLDDAFSQAIFATNFIFNDEKVSNIFYDTIGVDALESFRIIINIDLKVEVIVETEDGLIEEEKLLIEQYSKSIELLKNCATMYYEDDDNQQLILDYYLDNNGEMKKAFKTHFGEIDKTTGKDISKLKLFQTFQTLINLNYYYTNSITKKKLYNSNSLFAKGYLPEAPWNERFFTFKYFMLKKKGIGETVLSRSLSDGEYQFLHSIGLALIYRDTQSLFLLDEPETHFNPSWRAEYMSVLKKCFEETKAKAELLITSHSPFIVSDTKEENVLLFEKDAQGNANRKDIGIHTFGASVNEITDVIFNQQGTIGNLSLKELTDSLENINTLEDYNKAKKILSKLGDSIEKFDAYNFLNRRKKEIQ
jgi:restriction system-associated AAA family ATPase